VKNKHFGSSFEDFLKQQGIHEEATGHALKRVIAWQLAEAMKEKKISKSEMARRMNTSRTQVERFLDPENDSVQLDTIQKAATILGKRLVVTFEDLPRSAA
jgi:antitoxin HicB